MHLYGSVLREHPQSSTSPTKEYIINPDYSIPGIVIYFNVKLESSSHERRTLNTTSITDLYRKTLLYPLCLCLWPVIVSISRIADSAQLAIDYNPLTLYLSKIFRACDSMFRRYKFSCQFLAYFNASYPPPPLLFSIFLPKNL